MRLVVQRVSRAEVRIDGEVVGSIGRGAAVLVGVGKGDSTELAERLAERAGIVVVGGPDDAGLASEITAAVARSGGHAVSGCGRLTVRQSVEAIRRAAVLVTNDSAPLHLAQAVETPTVAIFGSTAPGFGFGPRGPRDQVVELHGLPCRPCSAHGPPNCPLGHHLCMKSLTVQHVLQAIEETGALRRRD